MKVAAVQFELSDFFARYGATEIGGLRLDLGDLRAFDHNLSAGGADFQRDIHSRFFPDIQNHAFGFVLLEAGRSNGHVIAADGQRREKEIAAAVGRCLSADPMLRVVDRDLSVGDRGAAGIGDRAGDGGGILRPGRSTRESRTNNRIRTRIRLDFMVKSSLRKRITQFALALFSSYPVPQRRLERPGFSQPAESPRTVY